MSEYADHDGGRIGCNHAGGRCSDEAAGPMAPVEMRHCDGCGEDYNAFEESHVGHGGEG